jgi:hypothetical protein
LANEARLREKRKVSLGLVTNKLRFAFQPQLVR